MKKIFFLYFKLFGIPIHFFFGFFEYVCEKLWPFEIEQVCVICYKVWIALVFISQHVGGCAQVLQ